MIGGDGYYSLVLVCILVVITTRIDRRPGKKGEVVHSFILCTAGCCCCCWIDRRLTRIKMGKHYYVFGFTVLFNCYLCAYKALIE